MLSSSTLNTGVLVLNRVYMPVHVTTVRRAFSLIYQGSARAVDESYQTFDFEAWASRPAQEGADCVGTIYRTIAVPRVIVLAYFDRIPKRHVRFSRTNIFSRDRFTCQYCGISPSRSELNLDHVNPRAQGGRTTWENVVCCCISCNRRKGGRTPEQARMRLRKRPTRPRWTPLMSVVPNTARYREWKPFLSTNEAAGFQVGAAS